MTRPTQMAERKDEDDSGQAKAGTIEKAKAKRPPMYKVLMLNDDYTPMDFVVYVLQRFFGASEQLAIEKMLTVHNKGSAVVGVFSREIAETKIGQVREAAEKNNHPLMCKMEKE